LDGKSQSSLLRILRDSVDVKFRVWVMMMKMVGCLGYVGRWVRKKRCYGFHIETV